MNSFESYSDLVCPQCRTPLDFRDDHLHCSSCTSDFRVDEGIPRLNKNPDNYYVEFPREDMTRLLQGARSDLDGTFQTYLRETDAPPRLGEYILGAGRAGWKFLLPVGEQTRVLDLGCGWGGLAYSLADSCAEVVAMDSTYERMQLLKIRTDRDGRDNIRCVCAGDGEFLPFADDQFDLIIINGVLEWVPSGMEGDPREVQLHFLKEARRVLKPGGVLSLGIENRNAWKTWFRQPDGHTDLHYVPWLPRRLADRYSRSKGKGPYRNYLYSESQYRQLLKEAGWDRSEFHIPCPGYHHPTSMVRRDDRAALRQVAMRKVQSRVKQVQQAFKGILAAGFPDAFSIFSGDQPWVSFLGTLESLLPITPPYRSYRMNGEMGMVTVIYPDGVLKLPIHARGRADLEREVETLECIYTGGHPLSEYRHLMPKVVTKGVHEGQYYAVFSIVPGVSGDRLSSEWVAKASAEAAAFLAHMPAVEGGFHEILDGLEQEVSSLHLSASQQSTVKETVAFVRAAYAADLPLVMAHGDFKLANSMFDPKTGSLTGVIDWGAGFNAEHPLYDLAFLAVDVQARRSGRSMELTLKRAMQGQLDDDLKERLTHLAEHRGLSGEDASLGALMRFQWLRRMAPLASGFEARRFDHRYIDRMFDVLSR
ncbi:MAG: ubiquinone/menaquinone biosynthesis C-methylase UbiE/aminoglycoside phosphotransferase [Candidatus Omnitrophota bacterium]|jgi:ubiquinone/menaquinone biosynthesis C-methylase UbiE/aminoglycoside phosphotransferase